MHFGNFFEQQDTSLDDVDDAPPLKEDRSTRVVSFLAKLRGLGHLDDENLDEQLHSRRFELLQLRQELGSDEPLLPNRLPSHRDIHNEVLYGTTPKIHQIVAHVLYPEQVPWPKDQDSLAPPSDITFSQPTGADETQNAGTGNLALSNKNSRDGGRRSQNTVPAKNEELQNDIEQKKAELSKGLMWLQKKGGKSPKSGKAPKDGGMEVEVRGQRLNSTVKGYACVPVDETTSITASGLKDETRQERLDIEKEAKLEAFKEKKLLDKIKELQEAKQNELKLQEEIQAKEEKRRQRNAHLKKKIEMDIKKKLEQENEEAKQKKQEKAKADEEEKKIRQYHTAQKDKLADWWHQKNESEFSGAPVKEIMHVIDKQKAKKRTPRAVTEKAKEAEDSVRQQKWAMEERPPLPPRAHDLKAPPLTERDVRNFKSVPMNWEVTAKTVSGAYGLSKKEYSSVTERTLRGVSGAGRMAAYDL